MLQDLLDAVEAAELLGPLVEGGEQGADGRRGARIAHVAASLLGRRGPPVRGGRPGGPVPIRPEGPGREKAPPPGAPREDGP